MLLFAFLSFFLFFRKKLARKLHRISGRDEKCASTPLNTVNKKITPAVSFCTFINAHVNAFDYAFTVMHFDHKRSFLVSAWSGFSRDMNYAKYSQKVSCLG